MWWLDWSSLRLTASSSDETFSSARANVSAFPPEEVIVCSKRLRSFAVISFCARLRRSSLRLRNLAWVRLCFSSNSLRQMSLSFLSAFSSNAFAATVFSLSTSWKHRRNQASATPLWGLVEVLWCRRLNIWNTNYNKHTAWAFLTITSVWN